MVHNKKHMYLTSDNKRLDGCTEYQNGRAWSLNGKLHREDGPAIEFANGTKRWFLNGKLHRIGGPAVVFRTGYEEWFIEGVLHRKDGPAVTFENRTTHWWYLNGKRHRENGPAIEAADKSHNSWWKHGVKYTEEEFNSGMTKYVFHASGSIQVKGER